MKRHNDRRPSATNILIDQLIADTKAIAAQRIESEFAWISGLCESPIERLFAAQLMHQSVSDEFDTRVEFLRPPSGQVGYASPPPVEGIYVFPQIIIGSYRVDFILAAARYGSTSQLIVELDGHDFHEKTREQAQRDKARDRYLVGQGYRVLRFTGSEIYRDPFKAAVEAICVLLDLA